MQLNNEIHSIVHTVATSSTCHTQTPWQPYSTRGLTLQTAGRVPLSLQNNVPLDRYDIRHSAYRLSVCLLTDVLG